MNAPDYRRLLRALPDPVLVLRPDADFTIVDANDAYLQVTDTAREAIVGRGLFDVFPDNPGDLAANGVENLRASLGRVIAGRMPDAMPLQKYDVRGPGGGFEERWWRPVNTPVLGDDGAVELILHRVDDATLPVRQERAERELERELRATEILESITEGFFALDRDWRFTYLNREALHILGARAEDRLGRTLWECYPGLEGSEFERAYRQAMEARVATNFTAFYEGHRRWYEAHAYPAPGGVSVYFRNVTQQREDEHLRQRLALDTDRQRRIYEVALSNTPDLIYIFDTGHRFIYANETLLAMWGRTREEALGKTCLELGYPEWHAAMHDRELDEVIATRRPIRGEVGFTGTAGQRVWDYIFVPVVGPEGDVVAVAGTSRDTTERRESEEAIASQAERLRQADRAKDEFIATLSHELRNPLAPLRNAVALMRMEGGAGERAARMLPMMERQVDHLVRLVDDLLEISRVTRGDFSLRRERIALDAVVRNALEASQVVLEFHRHEVKVAWPAQSLWVDGDPVRLAQVASNLLDNAAKYTPEGGRIEVVLAREGRDAVLRVCDNGAGIAPEAIARIFEMFNRGDRAHAQGAGGLGIGLALSRRLAQMHGASLEVASAGRGKGSEFTLRMPLIAEAAAPGPGGEVLAADVAGQRILVVDDNRDAADSLAMILRELGAEVRVAHDGRAALEAFPEFDPFAVLLDIGMPGMDGYEVARTLRTRYPQRRTPLIAVTGWGQAEDRARAREAGFDHHIVKPPELRALHDLLGAIARGSGTRTA